MPAVTELLRGSIEVRRGRRRSVELTLEGGVLVARAPHRLPRRELDPVLEELRERLERRLRARRVFDDDALGRRARAVVRRHLADQTLPPYGVRFSRRQRKRWGSCTVHADRGEIRISALLQGHPNWVLDHILLHELAHLVVSDHGPRFQRLIERSPDHDRGRGYFEALESLDLLGQELGSVNAPAPVESVSTPVELPLFAPRPEAQSELS